LRFFLAFLSATSQRRSGLVARTGQRLQARHVLGIRQLGNLDSLVPVDRWQLDVGKLCSLGGWRGAWRRLRRLVWLALACSRKLAELRLLAIELGRLQLGILPGQDRRWHGLKRR
jgi:hypothetical protein